MSTLFYLEKGCASIENAEKFSKKCGFYGLHALGSGCWLEGSPFLRGLRQIDSSSLKFAELVENGAKIADLVRHFVSSAEFNLVAVVIPERHVVFLFDIDHTDKIMIFPVISMKLSD